MMHNSIIGTFCKCFTKRDVHLIFFSTRVTSLSISKTQVKVLKYIIDTFW